MRATAMRELLGRMVKVDHIFYRTPRTYEICTESEIPPLNANSSLSVTMGILAR